MKKSLLMAVSAIVLFSSCNLILSKRVKGNGNITTETRNVSEFTGVDVSGNIDVIVKQDASSVKVETDQNLQAYIEVYNDGKTLRIKAREGYNLRSNHIKVYVSSPQLNSFDASGACSIMGSDLITSSEPIKIDLSGACNVELNLDAPKIDAGGSGSSTIRMKGRAKDVEIDGSGSTNIRCFDLVAENVDIDIAGAGDAELNASASITGSISGAGDVKYRGTAKTDVHTSGASSIKKVD